jgi:hypothetical protein
LLVDAASEAGAEVREEFVVEDIVFEDDRVTGIRGHDRDGRTVTEKARVVVGADGHHSLVARTVQPEHYNDKPGLLVAYYSYWSDLPMDGRFETYMRESRTFAAWPTNDDQTLIVGGWPFAEFEANKREIEGNFLKMLELAPHFADRVRAGKREERFVGTAARTISASRLVRGGRWLETPATTRTSSPPRGSPTPFRDAELCVTAVDEWLAGDLSFDVGMKQYRFARDDHVLRMYELTTQLATLEPPPPEFQQVLAAMHGNQEAMDGFVLVSAGVTSPAEYSRREHRAHFAASGHPPADLCDDRRGDAYRRLAMSEGSI